MDKPVTVSLRTVEQQEKDALPIVPAEREDWERNLALIWITEFVGVFGLTFTFPYLPLFLSHELGVRDSASLALWTGIAGAALGAGLVLGNPVWGRLGDRFGFKPLLARGLVLGGVVNATMALAQTTTDVTILRFLQGLMTGTVALATALASAGSRREKIGWSVGVVASSVAFGSAAGAVAGGATIGLVGLRGIFVVGGSLTALASLPLVLFVRETREKPTSSHHRQTSRFLRGVPSASLRAVGVLMSGQILFNLTASGAQPLAALKLLELAPREAGAATTVAFGLAGSAMAIASVASSTLTGRTGYRPVVAGAAALIGAGLLATASASATLPAVVAFGMTGFMSGLLAPAIASMVGLEAPAPARGALFGMSSSALGVGLVLGPLFAGVVAAVWSVSTALVAVALVSIGLAALLFAYAREPGGWRSDSLEPEPNSETTKLHGTT